MSISGKFSITRCIAVAVIGMTASAASASIVTEESASVAARHEEMTVPPSLLGGRADDLVGSHFSWGADLGTGIDLTTSDMTSVDIHAYLGYKSNLFRFLGVGFGINTMMNNSSRAYPLYAMLRTSFSSRPRLCFLNLRLGAAFNYFDGFEKQTDFYGSVGLGITLAAGRRFSSHLIIGYTFMPVRNMKAELPDISPDPSPDTPQGFASRAAHSYGVVSRAVSTSEPRHLSDLHFASIRIGCSF